MVSDQEYSLEPVDHPFLEKVDMPPSMEGFRVTDQQRLDESFKQLPTIPSKVVGEDQGGKLGDAAAAFDDHLGNAFKFIKDFFKGGLHNVAKERGIEVPAWSDKAAEIINNHDYNEAMGVTNIGAFLSYSKAAGLDSNKMLKAIEMKEAGASETQIYKKTGAELYEGKWGERVPYSGMEIKLKPNLYETHDFNPTTQEFTPTGKKSAFYTVDNPTTLSEVAEHSALFKADPTLKDIKVRKMTPVEESRYSPETFGFAEVTNNTVVLRPHLSEKQFGEGLVHEVEHIVQAKHGLPQGSAAEMFQDSAYRRMVASKERSYLDLVAKVHDLKGQAANIPPFTSETVDQLITIAHKGRTKPSALTPDEKLIYQDIKKNGLDKDLFELDIATNNVLMMDMQNARNYKVTKGEVASRAAEAELGKTAEEVSKVSYKKTLDAMVPENRRIDSPLDVGFPQGKNAEGRVTPPDNLKGANDNTVPRVVSDATNSRLQEKLKYIEALNTQREKLAHKDLLKYEPMDRAERTYAFTSGGKTENLPLGHVTLTKGSDPKKPFIVASYDERGKLKMMTQWSTEKWARKTFEDWADKPKESKVSTPEEEADFEKFIAGLSSKVNKDAFEAWLETAPVSKNVEDRTGQTYVPSPGPRVYTLEEARDMLKKTQKKKK